MGFQAPNDQSDDDPFKSDDNYSDIDTDDSKTDATGENSNKELNTRSDCAEIDLYCSPSSLDDESDVDSVTAPDFDALSDTNHRFSC